MAGATLVQVTLKATEVTNISFSVTRQENDDQTKV